MLGKLYKTLKIPGTRPPALAFFKLVGTLQADIELVPSQNGCAGIQLKATQMHFIALGRINELLAAAHNLAFG